MRPLPSSLGHYCREASEKLHAIGNRGNGEVNIYEETFTRASNMRSTSTIAGFEEAIKGSLAPGKLADSTVFSKDLMTVPEDQIPTTRMRYTIVGGRVQYEAK